MGNNINEEKIRLVSPTERELDLEISAETVRKEYEKVLKDYVARVKLPGFRKGYAPKEMVQKMFEAEIKEAVLDNLIPDNLRQELENLKVVPVNVPTVKSVDFSLEGGVRYRVAFEVWPEFDLPPDYLEKKVTRERVEVEEAEVEAVLNRLRENAAEYLPVSDRGVQSGDYVVIEIQGREVASKKFLPLEKVVVLAGHPDNRPQLNEVLPGLKAGEEKNFSVKYPDDYQQKRFAGKEIEYRLKVLEIKEKKLPELNDDFARLVDEVSGLDELKQKIKQDLARHKEEEARDRAINQYLEKLAAEINLVIPESMVKEEAQAIISRQFREEELKKIPADLWPRLLEQAQKQAESSLKNHILLRKVANREGLEVTAEEFEQELKKVSENRNIPLDQLKAALAREDREDDWKLNLLLRKTVDFLAGRIIIE
ncbi:MAG: trigger factor [Candidatus Saccharicenans sp.]|uniref:trigger factor n=1 Tax=Candidatus Saccharicenans sp. TaxID=2819258 RepID=UPI004048EF30